MPGKPASRCFVDSNVWLYAFVEGSEPEKTSIARQLIQDSQPIVSTQVINEVCVNLIKKAAFTEDQVRELIAAFFEKYSVLESTQAALLFASQLRERMSVSYWDSLILSSALQAAVPVLFTEDLQHGLVVDGTTRIENPFIGIKT